MKDVSNFTKIYIANSPIDFRKQHRGLALAVKHSLDLNPTQEKSIFIFFNKRKNSIRMIYWDTTGFAMWSKILEKDKFLWKYKGDESTKSLTPKELRWLLQGVDLSKVKTHEKVTLREVS